MSNKYFTYLILITISLFVLALISFLIQPRYETSLKRGGIIFENIKNQLNDIKEINIVNNEKKISIIKDQDNWYMASKSNYKVKNEVVRKNLIQISELRFFEKKTKEEYLYSRLNLDYPNDEDGNSKFISIINSDKESLIEFILGKRKKNGVYIKKLKDKQTWLTSGTLDMSSVERDWLETKILNIDYQDVKKVSVNHLNKKESFSLIKDNKNENFLIGNLTKEQIPKSDLIANHIGYFFTNLIFEDVVKRKNVIDSELHTKINFELFDGTNIFAFIFNEDKDTWINFEIDEQSTFKLKDNNKIYVNNIQNWSYKLSSKKYNVFNAKLDDLLVED
tara:strand:+ start:736 stop:1740 length:1005 start_codon:yes stop_codon:yes gene_type:complete